jgi:hypothetical protein
MRNWALETLAASAIAVTLALTAPVKNAAAMPVATADQPGLASGDVAGLERTALVCGPWACYWRPGYWSRPYPYWGWRRHYWWGWHHPGWGWRRPGWGWRRW